MLSIWYIYDKKEKNKKYLKSYILKEVNLDKNKITNSFYLKNRNYIYDDNEIIHKIPIFYNEIQIYSNII